MMPLFTFYNHDYPQQPNACRALWIARKARELKAKHPERSRVDRLACAAALWLDAERRKGAAQ